MTQPLLIILMGSKTDAAHCEKIASAARELGLEVTQHVASAHKTPERALSLLQAAEADPRPKVYITVAGRSNALSGFVDGSVSALIAHPELEDTLRQALRNSAQSGQIAVDPELPQRVANEIRAVRNEAGPRFKRVVLLCSLDIRRHLRKLIEGDFFDLPVLSFQDLSADVPVVPIGQIRG